MRIFSHAARACLALAVGSGLATGAELIVLASGFRLAAARHEIERDRIRVYSASGGVMEFPLSAVAEIERLEDPRDDDRNSAAAPPEPTTRSVGEVVAALAAEAAVHPGLLDSLMAAESACEPGAVSSKGAVGLMQLMPAAARELRVDPRDPGDNLSGGARYFRSLLDRYAGRRDQVVRAIAAYNAGPGAVDRHDGVPPYPETRAFVGRVLERFLAGSRPACAGVVIDRPRSRSLD